MTEQSLAKRGWDICLLLALASIGLSAESPRDIEIQKISQAENSERVVARFLRNLPVSYKSDTVYVFFVDPMRAPRLEGAVNQFTGCLRKAGVKSDIITLVISDRKRAAEKYMERRQFASDHSFVVNDAILKSFVFNQGFFGPHFVAKLSVKTGQLLSSYALSTIDSASAAWLAGDNSRPRAQKPASERQERTQVNTDAYRIRCEKRQRLQSDEAHPISTTSYVCVNSSANRLAFRDKLTNHFYVFDLNAGSLSNVLSADSGEERRFCGGMPEQVYSFMRQGTFAQYVGCSFASDTTLLIIASLPRAAWIRIEGKDSDFGLWNVPCFLEKRVSDNRLLECDTIKSLPDSIPEGFNVTGASFVLDRDLIFLSYSRGWPHGVETLNEEVPPEDNPFTDEFYRHPLYEFAAYKPSGDFVRMWGNLSGRRQRLQLGYRWNASEVVRSQDDRYYLSDGCSGQVRVYDQNAALIDSIELFDDPPLTFPHVDKSKEPELYLSEALRLNYRAVIKDLLVTRSCCYALVLWDGNQPIVYKVGLRGHTNKKYALPVKYQGKDAKHYLLRQTPTGVATVSLLESGDETWYCEFKLP